MNEIKPNHARWLTRAAFILSVDCELLQLSSTTQQMRVWMPPKLARLLVLVPTSMHQPWWIFASGSHHMDTGLLKTFVPTEQASGTPSNHDRAV